MTDDPLIVEAGQRKVKIDLGAERIIGAEKDDQKIAVEIKSFLDDSPLADLYEAVGKFDFYHFALQKKMPERVLFLAMPKDAYEEIFFDPFYEEYRQLHKLKLIIYHPKEKSILKWIVQ
ncbi:MAG: XisH protein [Saprospiraceae bacterium]|nr:XisH protein [Saprospiraceae bacterium]